MDLCTCVKLKREKFLIDALLRHEREAEKFRDAVIAMHHEIACFKREKRIFRAASSQRASSATNGGAMENLSGGRDDDAASWLDVHAVTYAINRKSARQMTNGSKNRTHRGLGAEQFSDASAFPVALADQHRISIFRKRNKLCNRNRRILIKDWQRARVQID